VPPLEAPPPPQPAPTAALTIDNRIARRRAEGRGALRAWSPQGADNLASFTQSACARGRMG
jgi:hypothetical protein